MTCPLPRARSHSVRPARWLLAGFIFLGAAVPCVGEELLDPGEIHALIVGVLEWESPGFSSFSAEDRQDQLLAEVLVERGVPADQIVLLLDREATRERVESELVAVASAAGPDASLLFYYAGHGQRRGENCYFANYDMTGPKDGLDLREVARLLDEHFRGRRLLAFADCCHSGSLSTVVDELAAREVAGSCVTSVVASSTSTGNWTFTQTLIEALRGDPTLDHDRDGFVELGELDRAVGLAMAYREEQKSGSHHRGNAPSLRLVAVVPDERASRFRDASGEEERAFELGEHVSVEGERRRTGRIVGRSEGGDCVVRFYAYATHEDVALAAAKLRRVELESVAVGTAVAVRKGRDALPGHVTAVDGPFHRVKFPAWPEMAAEWTLASRFTELPEEEPPPRAAMVEWRGTWYPAVVLEEKARRYFIHYVGYGSSWDEWVGEDRIRLTPAGETVGEKASKKVGENTDEKQCPTPDA